VIGDGDRTQAALPGAADDLGRGEDAVAVAGVNVQVGAMGFGAQLRQALTKLRERTALRHSLPACRRDSGQG